MAQKRERRVKSVATELVEKAREALTAVQMFNNRKPSSSPSFSS
jgi:hypothetical protein